VHGEDVMICLAGGASRGGQRKCAGISPFKLGVNGVREGNEMEGRGKGRGLSKEK